MLDTINKIITFIMIIIIICLILCYIGKNFVKNKNTIEKFYNNNSMTLSINLIVKGELYIILAKSPLVKRKKGSVIVYNSIDKNNESLSIQSNRLIDSNGTNIKTITIKNYSKGDQILFYHRTSVGQLMPH